MTTPGAPSAILDMIVGHRNHTPEDKREKHEPDMFDQGMLADIDFIAESIRWAWNEAWETSTGRRERGVVHRGLSEKQKAEQLAIWRRLGGAAATAYVPGAKHDLGKGNHLAQRALRTAATNLSQCDALLDKCCRACLVHRSSGSRAPDKMRLPVVVNVSNCDLAELIYATDSIRWRLNYIVDRTTLLDAANASLVLRHINRADRKLKATRGPLEKAHRTATRDASISVDKFCITCCIRTVRRGGNECATCATWRYRHGGEPRPKELDAA